MNPSGLINWRNGAANRWSVLLACQCHHAAIRLQYDVVAFVLAQWAGRTKPRDAAIHDIRAQRAYTFVINTEALRNTWPKALDHDISRLNQANCSFATLTRLQIEHNTALISIRTQE